MARFTIVNRSPASLILPSFIGRKLAKNGSLTVDKPTILVDDLPAALQRMVDAGLISVTSLEDPDQDDALTIPTFSVIKASVAESVSAVTADVEDVASDVADLTENIGAGGGSELQIENSVAISGVSADIATIVVPTLPTNGKWYPSVSAALTKLVDTGSAGSTIIQLLDGVVVVAQWTLASTDTDATYKAADYVSSAGVAGGTTLTVAVTAVATALVGPLSMKLNLIPLVQLNALLVATT